MSLAWIVVRWEHRRPKPQTLNPKQWSLLAPLQFNYFLLNMKIH